jgi:branched-chain amino acid transport system substrate-binding protein
VDHLAELVLAASQSIPLGPDEVFALFGSHRGGGWLLEAECDSVRPGSPVTLVLPDGLLGPEPTCVLGRIVRVVQGRTIEIMHDQPWQGMLRLLIRPDAAGGSSMTLTARVDQRALEWLSQRRGWPSTQSSGESVFRIGLLTSKTGPAAVFAVASEYMAELAIEEINADGGLHRQSVELVVADDATNPVHAALEAHRLIAAGCRAVIAGVTSASFAAVEDVLAASGLPVIHTVVNEGGGGSDYVLRWGERPLSQVRAASDRVMKSSGGKRWYMIGNDYRWPRGAHRAGRRALTEAGGHVAGNQFVPLGTQDFDSVIENIERSGADCVLSTLIGSDEVAFERQVFTSGMRSKWETLSLVLEESARERIGDEAARGIWTSLGYFEGLDTPENRVLVRRYRERYGRWAPPLSSLSESVYEAFMIYATAVRSSSPDTPSVIRALGQVSARMPRGLVASAGPHALRQELYVARAVSDGFKIINN